MSDHPRELSTERLRLRAPRMSDAEAVYSYASDAEVARHVGWPQHRSIEDTREFLSAAIESFDEPGEMVTYLVERLGDGVVIGSTGYVPDHGLQIGYVVRRESWGQGYATEMARAMVALGWFIPEVHRIWAICDVANPGSARVMEKAGLILEGTLRRYGVHPNIGPDPRDCLCYAIVR